MTTRLFSILTATALAGGLAAGCSDAPGTTSPNAEASLDRGGNGRGNNAVGAVYTMSNAAGSNEVIVLNRASDGTLSEAARVATGGAGTGASIGGSQDAIELSEDGRFLFVVNAGSDEISVLAVRKSGLRLTDVEASGGATPISVRSDGTLSTSPTVTDPPGRTPFRFDFGQRDQLIVSEAFVESPMHPIPGASATSSFTLGRDGTLTVNPGGASVRTFQTVACWVEVSNSGRFAYVTNTGSDNITGYRIGNDGSLTRLNADGITAVTGPGPVDLELSRDGRFLYVANIGDGSINAFKANPSDGSLTPIQTVKGLPTSLFGLAAE